MPEWTIGAVSKTVVVLVATVGSNPTLSAERKVLAGIFLRQGFFHKSFILVRELWDNMCTTLGFTKGLAHMNRQPDYNRIYEIAESQAGYFTAQQARQVGFSYERLSADVKSGRFQRITQCIYRLKHYPSSPHEDLFIAWLRAGPTSVVSHESALAVYELSDVMPGEVHLIVPQNTSRRRENIRQHRYQLAADEITKRNGLPITTVERTIQDVISAGLAEEQVRLAVKQALQRGLTDREKLLSQAQRANGRAARSIRDSIESVSHEIR